MELRQTEDKVNELFVLYERLRKTPLGNDPTSRKIALLPELEPMSEEVSKQQQPADQQPVEMILLSHLQTLRTSLDELVPKMDKFRKRLAETDAVTGNPRYGKKTEGRVTILLKRYGKLTDAMETSDSANVVSELQNTVNQLEEQQQRALEEEERKRREAQEALNREREEEERKLQQQQAEQDAAHQRELQELNQRAEESRRARQAQLQAEQRAREESQRQDREWMATIRVGPAGVQEQLDKIREATKDDASACMDALTALHTLFSQIVSHPEETKFRRVRRDHPKYNQDIGRHPGGKEVLIAAGFRLGAIDEVPSFISSEPNIEKDMDGWSDWFNLLKTTLEIVEQEMIK